ncbi:hypothetical protein [Mucilaginibacter sp. UYCu711]|uniref:hypothetical protein n=1 Tax=Mucilaginibacter sp. UYCu711 TaxID=3156339 RepID=UPI003D194930
MDVSYVITEEGFAFVEQQIKKSNSFFLKFPFILLIIAVAVFLAKIHPITLPPIYFGAIMYLILLFLHLSRFKKTIEIHQHIIKNVDVRQGELILTGFGSYRKGESTYILKLSNRTLKKGTPENADKNIYSIKNTFYIESEDHPGESFFFISSFWDDWQEIENLISHE